MAINKAVAHPSKSHAGLKHCIEYVLRTDKVTSDLVTVLGPYNYDEMDKASVYQSFLDEKKQWNKDSGRMCAHNVISWHKDEKSNRKKLHSSKKDLESMKQMTNQMCREKGLTVAEKGKHFDGTPIEPGEVITWNKNKYQLFQKDVTQSFVWDCAMAVINAVKNCFSKESFIDRMQESGWTVHWSDKRKHITFENKEGQKVRDSNLAKTFQLEIGKEELINEFMKDMMHKISRRITDWAEENRVDLVVMGHNIYQKQSIELGHVNNQNIVQIPFQVFAGMLRYKLEEKGIAFLDTEEAYTSKADFLAKDEMPEYHRGDSIPKMSGKRIQRGLYRHWNGWISNADINGAANILRKVLPNVKEWDRGVVDTPYAIRVA